jgi:hypothetical protein
VLLRLQVGNGHPAFKLAAKDATKHIRGGDIDIEASIRLRESETYRTYSVEHPTASPSGPVRGGPGVYTTQRIARPAQ